MRGPTRTATPDDRAREAQAKYRETFDHIALKPIDHQSPLWRLYLAGLRYAEFWERRARALTRQLHAALATDALSDEDRTAIIRTLHGSTQRDARLLRDSERELLDLYAGLEDADRQMFRRMMTRISATSESAGR